MMDDFPRPVQLYVRAPAGSTTDPRIRMRHADETIKAFAACFSVPPNSDGLPVQEDDGTFEVRVFDPNSVGLVKTVLTGHEGLEVVREQAMPELSFED